MKRQMSIKSALEWAFGSECAGLDFGETLGDNARPGISTIWQIMQRGQLGCSIDGGGYSLPAADADIIASAVAALPVGCGGRAMAIEVARLARGGMSPDWFADDRPRLVPDGWRQTKHGTFAVTELVEVVRLPHRGRMVSHEVRCCPVRVVPDGRQVSAARRGYLDWWGALLHLQSQLRSLRALDTLAITREMPPMTPWRDRGREVQVAA